MGLDDERVWNSFFLQYLWEFVLGMWLASVYFEHPEKLKLPKMWILVVTMVVGLGLTGVSGFAGGIWKSYNDIPSLVGYMSMVLIIYKIGVKPINRFLNIPTRYRMSGIWCISWYSPSISSLQGASCLSM